MGWDPHFGFQLYQSDPSGNYGGWKATCIGNNHQVRRNCFVSPSLCLSICLFVCLSICLFVYLSICLFVCLSIWLFFFQAAISMLKQEYKDTPNLSDALDLAVKVLYKTLDSTKLNSEKGVCVCV